MGYIAFELTSATTPEIARAIEERVAGRDMHLLMANDAGSRERERSYLQLFEKQRVGGIIVSPLGDLEPGLAQMRKRGIASVLSARRAKTDEQASVTIDHVEGGRLAVAHLLERGHRRIGFVASSLNSPAEIVDAPEAYRAVLAAIRDTAPERAEAFRRTTRWTPGRQLGEPLDKAPLHPRY